MKIVVIGGGAAGFFGAIVSAEANPHAEVLILEKGREILSKVRISGGGRCNVTHFCFEPAVLVGNYPRGHLELRGPFSRFQPSDTVDWFERHGVSLKTEPDGRMFPTSNQSSTIVECLTRAANAAGVTLQTQITVQTVVKEENQFVLRLSDGQSIRADRLLLATGSNREGYRLAEMLGHTLVEPVPSLFTFQIASPLLEGLSGLSVNPVVVSIDQTSFQQQGPLLITHWGVSGPAVLKLSAWAARELHKRGYQFSIRINWLPTSAPDQTKALFATLRQESPKQQISVRSPFPVFARRLWERFVQQSQIPETRIWTEVSNDELGRLLGCLHETQLNVQGKSTFKDEFVTCGGVALNQVNFKTMESRQTPGLHFAGELLDVDGVTGGFNFQNAWTTGYLAGTAMALTK